MRNFQAGKHADDAARILNEIQAAKLCLLDPGKRAEYDAGLRQEQTASDPAAVAARQPAGLIVDLDALSGGDAAPEPYGGARTAVMLPPRRQKSRTQARWGIAAVGAVALAAAMAFGVSAWRLRPAEPVVPPGTAAAPAEKAEGTATEVASTAPDKSNLSGGISMPDAPQRESEPSAPLPSSSSGIEPPALVRNEPPERLLAGGAAHPRLEIRARNRRSPLPAQLSVKFHNATSNAVASLCKNASSGCLKPAKPLRRPRLGAKRHKLGAGKDRPPRFGTTNGKDGFRRGRARHVETASVRMQLRFAVNGAAVLHASSFSLRFPWSATHEGHGPPVLALRLWGDRTGHHTGQHTERRTARSLTHEPQHKHACSLAAQGISHASK